MAFSLDQVVPWGRSFGEYRRMFALTDGDLAGRILGCADGPASFNAEASRMGHRIVSCDPLYRFKAAGIRERIDETADVVAAQTRQNQSQFVWREFGSVDDLVAARRGAMDAFLADFEQESARQRYVDAELPHLPFDDWRFDLAVCSHFLFLYSERLSAEFHVRSLKELLRVASEVRVFPLLDLEARRSSHVDFVVDALRADGHDALIETVEYEFQKGGNQMLRVRRAVRGAA